MRVRCMVIISIFGKTNEGTIEDRLAKRLLQPYVNNLGSGSQTVKDVDGLM